MRKLIFYILIMLPFSLETLAQCFNPVWSEFSFQPMLIYVSVANLYGNNLQAGDEIGVFDGDLCVGMGVLSEELTDTSDYLAIEVSRRYIHRPGYTPGHTILYRFCSEGEEVRHSVIPSYIEGAPTFIQNATCIVELHVINNPPTVQNIPDTTATQDLPYSSTITALDMDGDSLVYSAPILPAWLGFDEAAQTLSGTPGNSNVGDNLVVITINDGIVEVIQDVAIFVENVNDPPIVTSEPVTEARPGVAYSYLVTAEDIDGDSLIFSALVLPGWLMFNPTTRILSATPGEHDIGDQHVAIRISDGIVYTDHTFVISVSNANHAPTFISEPTTTVEAEESYAYTLIAQDIDGDELVYCAPVLPAWLTFDTSDNRVSGIPELTDTGRHEVTVRVSDGIVSTDQCFPVFVKDKNHAPVFISVPVTEVSADELYLYYVAAEDPDEDDLIFSAPVLPDWLSFDLNNQVLFGTPLKTEVGEHSVTLQVTDGIANAYQDFTVTVDFVYSAGELNAAGVISVYPNPSDGIIYISMSGMPEMKLNIEIMDSIGKVLFQDVFPACRPINELYDLSSGQGVHLIRIYNDSYLRIIKLLII